MTDPTTLTIDLTEEERQQLEALARQQGYETSSAFVRALLSHAIAEAHDFDSKEGVLAGLRESWQQAMNDETRPISELWDRLDDE